MDCAGKAQRRRRFRITRRSCLQPMPQSGIALRLPPLWGHPPLSLSYASSPWLIQYSDCAQKNGRMAERCCRSSTHLAPCHSRDHLAAEHQTHSRLSKNVGRQFSHTLPILSRRCTGPLFVQRTKKCPIVQKIQITQTAIYHPPTKKPPLQSAQIQ
jgi:hypothetical protein